MSLKVFGKNAIIYSLGTAGLRFSAFLLIPVYTHFLPIKEFGLLSTLLLTIQFMVTIIDFGVRDALMRFTPEYNREGRIKYLLGSLIVINFLDGIIVLTISLTFLKDIFQSVLHTTDVNTYIILSCVAATTQSVSVNIISYFRASNEGMKYMVINLVTSLIIVLSSLLFFVWLNAGVKGAIIAQILSYTIPGICVFAYVKFKVGINITISDMKYILIYCMPLLLSTAGFSINSISTTYLLSYFTSLEVVGVYYLALRIASIASMLIVLPFQLAYQPYVFSNIESKDIKTSISRLTTYMLLTYTIIAFLIVFIFRDLIHVIAPKEYFPAYNFIFFLLPAMAANGLFFVGQSLLHINKKTNVNGIIVIVLTLINLVLNYFLIRYLSIWGIVISYNLFYISIALTILKYGVKEFPIRFELTRIYIICLIFIALLGITFILYTTYSFFFYTLVPLSAILIGIFVYNYFLYDNEKQLIRNFLDNYLFVYIKKLRIIFYA